jgi:hypothetical protein
MRNFYLYLALLAIVLSGYAIYCSIDNYYIDRKNEKIREITTELVEKSYFYGQRDALQGDVRIQFGADSTWHWTKSPWLDSTQKPLFIPTKENNKKQ